MQTWAIYSPSFTSTTLLGIIEVFILVNFLFIGESRMISNWFLLGTLGPQELFLFTVHLRRLLLLDVHPQQPFSDEGSEQLGADCCFQAQERFTILRVEWIPTLTQMNKIKFIKLPFYKFPKIRSQMV